MTSQRSPLLLLVPLLAATWSPAQSTKPTSDLIVSTYHMAVELKPKDKLITGTQRITWKNTTGAPTSELRFHLYINAFRDPDSTFMRESDSEFRALWRPDECGRPDRARGAHPSGRRQRPRWHGAAGRAAAPRCPR